MSLQEIYNMAKASSNYDAFMMQISKHYGSSFGLLKKWQLKKIATLAFINDECDDMNPADRKSFYTMMEAVFSEIILDVSSVGAEFTKNGQQ